MVFWDWFDAPRDGQMNSDRYIPTDTEHPPIDEQLAALILKRAPGAVVYKRALDALRTLQERNRMLMREREGAREDAAKYQRLAAELSDKLNGTPCAEIRWMQERDTLRAELAAANERLSDIASAARQAMQQGDNGGSPVAALEYIYQTARIDAMVKGGVNE